MRFLLYFLAVVPALASQPDPLDLIRKSLVADAKNSARLEEYAYVEQATKKDMTSEWAVKKRESKTHEYFMMEGTPFRRLVAKNGQPIGPDEKREQEENFRKVLEERRSESPADRAKRLKEFQERRERLQEPMREIPDAFDFRIVGEQVLAGRPAWIVEATPREGYSPKTRYGKIFTELAGRVWIDKTDFVWARAEGELRDTVTFGWIVARMHGGSKVLLEQKRGENGIWFPQRVWYLASLRIGLVKQINVELDALYSNFRRSTQALFAAAPGG
jgi:hypothetical protein